MARPVSTSPAASQPGFIDPLMETMIDLSDYDNVPFQSPSLSPSASSKTPFARPIKTETTTPALLPTSQPLSGPSHQYDLYKQQTGMVPGALASTLAVNSNSMIPGYADFESEYLGLTTNDVFDFNMAPSQQGSLTSPEMVDLEFDSPTSDPNFFFESTVNPSSLGGQEPSGLPSPPVGTAARVWPGMHQQAAAMAKAQAQQQQRQRAQAKQPQKSKSPQVSDPIVEQKITQLLNSMRAKPATDGAPHDAPLLNISRPKKDEEDMDEDERLLASEEGKKLSSKERRQLRNKVSARAFRSRRKEYITHLETEITKKVNENGLLRAENRALVEENKRLENLTRTLLASPAFSDFMDHLTSHPEQIPQAQPQPQQQEAARQIPKDVNPYNAQQQLQHQQHISLAMIPEQNMDFSADTFNFTPQVYSVLETPEPALDASVLSGKTSDIVEDHLNAAAAEEEKVEMPILVARPAVAIKKDVAPAPVPVVDEKFENNPAFALYHDSPAAETSAPVELDTEGLSNIDIFGGIEPEKMLARFELVDASEEDASAMLAMARVQRISASLEGIMARLELLTVGL